MTSSEIPPRRDSGSSTSGGASSIDVPQPSELLNDIFHVFFIHDKLFSIFHGLCWLVCELRWALIQELGDEDLCEDFEAQIDGVQRFLSIPVEPVKSATRKQESRRLVEIIENYDEVKGFLETGKINLTTLGYAQGVASREKLSDEEFLDLLHAVSG